MGGSATTSNTASSNDNKNNYQERQSNLQKNINKLKSKGATKESIANLEAKKTKEAKQFKQNTQGIKDGVSYVANELGLYTNQPGGSSTQTKTLRANKLKGKDADFYGREANRYTNAYLVSIGEAKKNSSGSYSLTSQGYKMKYGRYNPGGPQNPSAMGSGDSKGILTSTAISKPMFESQKKVQNIALGAMAIMGVPLTGTAYAYNNRPNNSYDNYLSKFYSTMSSSGIQSAQKINQTTNSSSNNVVSNQDQVVDPNTEEKEISTTTKFKKKKANNASDNIASARSLFKKTGQTITGSMV